MYPRRYFTRHYFRPCIRCKIRAGPEWPLLCNNNAAPRYLRGFFFFGLVCLVLGIFSLNHNLRPIDRFYSLRHLYPQQSQARDLAPQG